VRAGLKPGDRVIAIDGRPMRDAIEVLKAIRFRWAGEKVRFTVTRVDEKKPLDIDVVMEPRPGSGGSGGPQESIGEPPKEPAPGTGEKPPGKPPGSLPDPSPTVPKPPEAPPVPPGPGK
jgi:hypothetical protein